MYYYYDRYFHYCNKYIIYNDDNYNSNTIDMLHSYNYSLSQLYSYKQTIIDIMHKICLDINECINETEDCNSGYILDMDQFTCNCAKATYYNYNI